MESKQLKQALDVIWFQRLIRTITDEFSDYPNTQVWQAFEQADWPSLSLMQRVQAAARLLYPPLVALQANEAARWQGLLASAADFKGLAGLVFPQMVMDYPPESFDLSMQVLAKLTEYSSAEFAIRPFIEQDASRTLAQMQAWSHSENHHLRRLASEGCRPRLPWGKALNQFKQDPTPILPILQNLIHDPSLYVRKSVANNLNDIGKDHPEVLLTFCQAWLGTSTEADWIIKHASRNLLKQREPRFLALLSLPNTEHIELLNWHSDAQVKLGEALHYAFELQAAEVLGRLRVEIQVDYPRPSGVPLRKVFKLAEADYAVAHKKISKTLSFKPLTTRVYYPGQHKIQLVINGEIKHQAWFEVIV
ncbi:MAG: DNA alkylation repair protein [Thiomicrospira sp.]|nr:DNA alkylation repair protein [Thiomicrospira sp.]